MRVWHLWKKKKKSYEDGAGTAQQGKTLPPYRAALLQVVELDWFDEAP